MTIRGGLQINRTFQIQLVDNRSGAQIEDLAYGGGDLAARHALLGAEGLHVDGYRVGNANSVGDLDFDLVGQAGSHDVLRNPTGGVRGGTIDLGRVLAGERATAVMGGATVGVDDDLAAGLTGRKIIVDTYGGAAHHGGGAFSGKDPSKVDRSAAYAARWVAKNIVAAGLAHKVEVQVAYAIGVADPVSINVETYGTEIGVTREQIQQAVRKVFDLRPAAIIDELDLKRPIYSKTAAYGHFGRKDADFTWEATNMVDELKEAIKA